MGFPFGAGWSCFWSESSEIRREEENLVSFSLWAVELGVEDRWRRCWRRESNWKERWEGGRVGGSFAELNFGDGFGLGGLFFWIGYAGLLGNRVPSIASHELRSRFLDDYTSNGGGKHCTLQRARAGKAVGMVVWSLLMMEDWQTLAISLFHHFLLGPIT